MVTFTTSTLLVGYETQTWYGMLNSKKEEYQIKAIATFLIIFGFHVEHAVQSLLHTCLYDVRSWNNTHKHITQI